MSNKDKTKNILILTSAFPRWKGDERDMFIFNLADRLSATYNISIIVPRDKGGKSFEEWGDLKIYRHKQFPFGLFQ